MTVLFYCRMLPLVSHGEYADGTGRQTDRRQTVTLRFPLDVTSVIKSSLNTPLQLKRCEISQPF